MKPISRIAVVALSAVMVLTGCASTHDSPSVAAEHATPPSMDTPVKSSAPSTTKTLMLTAPALKTSEISSAADPEEVGHAFVPAAFSWDTRSDRHLTQALQKGDYMVTEELAATFVTPQNASGEADWNQAAEHQWAGTDGYEPPGARELVTLQLVDVNGQWLVSSFDLTYLTE